MNTSRLDFDLGSVAFRLVAACRGAIVVMSVGRFSVSPSTDFSAGEGAETNVPSRLFHFSALLTNPTKPSIYILVLVRCCTRLNNCGFLHYLYLLLMYGRSSYFSLFSGLSVGGVSQVVMERLDCLCRRWMGIGATRMVIIGQVSFAIGFMMETFMVKVWIKDTNCVMLHLSMLCFVFV